MTARRGRPKCDRFRDAFTGDRGIALRVFELELAYGRKRGDLTAATKKVAADLHIRYQTIKRAATRNRHVRPMADILALTKTDLWTELERRTSGMPPDVRDVLLEANGVALLEFLRAEKIDSTCPEWLIARVRSGHDLADLLSPK